MSTRKAGMDMKLSRAEQLLIAVAAAFVIFAAGYFAGRSTSGSAVSLSSGAVTTLPEAGAVDAAPELEAETPAQTRLPQSGEVDAPERVNINTATAEELQTLSGIGPVIAQRILDYRTENGAFQSVGELTKVSGIGEKLLEKIYDYITVG